MWTLIFFAVPLATNIGAYVVKEVEDPERIFMICGMFTGFNLILLYFFDQSPIENDGKVEQSKA